MPVDPSKVPPCLTGRSTRTDSKTKRAAGRMERTTPFLTTVRIDLTERPIIGSSIDGFGCLWVLGNPYTARAPLPPL